MRGTACRAPLYRIVAFDDLREKFEMRNRWMYYATGLPGWMRFGFSPGWVDRSPTGLGPCASYMMTGTWPTPQAQEYWQAAQSGQAPYPYYGAAWGGMNPPAFGMGFAPGFGPEQELDMLKGQADMLKQQMEQINNRISELDKKEEEQNTKTEKEGSENKS